MIRVRNGEEFLLPSVLSIIDLVDEVVIAEGLSTDSTPELIELLVARYPHRVKSLHYPHDCARTGEEFRLLHAADPKSPRLYTVFYNWCLERCSCPFVMKWDDDMIALPPFRAAYESFLVDGGLTWDFGGHNLSADREHLLTWAAPIEPRIYPRSPTKFIRSPQAAAQGYEGEVADTMIVPTYWRSTEEPLYAHMKYCKKDPGSNQSPEFRKQLESRIAIAGPLPAEVGRAVDHWLEEAEAFLARG